jgi:hypothetical protein
VVEFLLAGRNMSELARSVGLSVSSIQACKNGLANRILDYWDRTFYRKFGKYLGI